MIASLDFLAALVIAIAIVPSWHFAELWPLVVFAGAMACLVIVRHKDNIGG